MGKRAKKKLHERAKDFYNKDVAVVREVKTLTQARSKETIAFCVEELQKGTAFNDLRKKLGLGPSYTDHRWREIRAILTTQPLPEDEEKALTESYETSNYLMYQLDMFMSELNARMDQVEGDKNEHHFWKLKFEAMKTQMEKYEKRFEHYIEMKALRQKDARTTGPSIIYQNNYYVPRPGDEVKEVGPKEIEAKDDE